MKTFKKVATSIQQAGGKYKRDVVIKTFQTDDGLLHEFTTFGSEHGTHGAVIAVTPNHEVVTMYQFRSGPERWLYELPGGGFHDGEDVQAGALRELREETGYQSTEVTYLGESCRDAYTNGTWHYFLATNCVPGPEGLDLDQEELDQGAELRLISIEQLIDNAKQGDMTDAVAVLMAYDKLMEMKGRVS